MSTCVSPFEYFVNYAEWYISENPGTTFADVLNQVNVFPLTANICCPTCGINYSKPYVLSGRFDIDYPSNFFSFFQNVFPLNGDCCLNTHVTKEIYEIIKGNSEWDVTGDIDDLPKPCCTTSEFKTCVTKISEFLNSQDFNEYIIDYNNQLTGIAEWNLIDGDSLLCNIYEVLYSKTPIKALEYILNILDYGFVVQCTPTGVIITSIPSFIALTNPTICFRQYNECTPTGDPNIDLFNCNNFIQLPSVGNASQINGRPVYILDNTPGQIKKVYYDGTQWVYYFEEFALAVQTLSSSGYFPLSTTASWDPVASVTGYLNSSLFGSCPVPPPTTTTTTLAP